MLLMRGGGEGDVGGNGESGGGVVVVPGTFAGWVGSDGGDSDEGKDQLESARRQSAVLFHYFWERIGITSFPSVMCKISQCLERKIDRNIMYVYF